MVRTAPAHVLLDQTLGRLGIPAEVVGHTSFPSVFDSKVTEKALAGSGIAVPDLESYARTLWGFWEENLDDTTGRDKRTRAALKGKHVVITGASSGIGKVTALKVAQAGGIPVLVARGKDKLEETKATIELRGGQAYVFPCDLSDLRAIDDLCERLSTELPTVDFVVNNAGRSIRRSLRLSHDRFHDFERTMQLNYFGAIRLLIGLMPKMHDQKSGHIVNISSIGVQTNPPRFSAYVASKAALDAWSNVVASEVVGHGISFTNIHMPLVRTPMIAPTKMYDKFPTLSPAQAADLVVKAMVEKPHEINTLAGNAGAVAHTFAPKAAFRILNLAYQVFPDSAAAKAKAGPSDAAPEVPAARGRGPCRAGWPGVRADADGPAVPGRALVGLWSQPVADRAARVDDPLAPAARVERGRDAGDLERQHVVRRGHPRAAVRRHRGAAGRADRRVEVAELTGGPEPPVGGEVLRRRHVDRAGDPAGHRVDRLGLAAVAHSRPGVDDDVHRPHVGRGHDRHGAGHRGERARGHRSTGAGLDGQPARRPGRPAAVEHPHVRVAVVAQQPPATRCGMAGPVVVDDHRPVAGHAGGAHGRLEDRESPAAGAARRHPAVRPERCPCRRTTHPAGARRRTHRVPTARRPSGSARRARSPCPTTGPARRRRPGGPGLVVLNAAPCAA